MTPQANDLRSVLALLERATPGPWRCTDGPAGYQHRISSDDADGETVCDVERTSADAALIAAAVNFLRKHGAALLHGGGGEAAKPIGYISVATLADLTDPAWQAKRNEPADLWTVDGPPSRAIIPVYTTPPPQPRGDGESALWALRQILHDLPDSRDWMDPDVEKVARKLVAQNPDADLAAAPGEGSGER